MQNAGIQFDSMYAWFAFEVLQLCFLVSRASLSCDTADYVWLLDPLTLQAFCPKLWHWLVLRWLITIVSKGLMPSSAVGGYWQLWPPLLLEPLPKALFVALWTLSHLSSCAISWDIYQLWVLKAPCPALITKTPLGLQLPFVTLTAMVLQVLRPASLKCCQLQILNAPTAKMLLLNAVSIANEEGCVPSPSCVRWQALHQIAWAGVDGCLVVISPLKFGLQWIDGLQYIAVHTKLLRSHSSFMSECEGIWCQQCN